ncbi:MAG: right-handed parallel beta-helix repeat-containing protein, partial [Chloroflexota bacterium]
MDPARQTLCQILATHGRALCDDPRRVEALLRDLCGERRRDVFVLVNALKVRVAADLLGWPAGVPGELLLSRLTQRLCDDLGFTPEVARWGVESWALALAEAPNLAGGGHSGPDRDAWRPQMEGHALPPKPFEVRGSRFEGFREGDGASNFERRTSNSVFRVEWPHAGTLPCQTPPEDVCPHLGASPCRVVTVAQDGSADCTRIGDALARALPGTRILVQPGVYAEGLVLDKPVEIVGAGLDQRGERTGAGQVVVEATETSCLRMDTDYASVRGLVLRGRTGLENRTLFAVDVPQGQLVLEDCVITSDALACIAIRGQTANPVLRRCLIHDGKGSGVFVHHGGMGTLEDCAIFGNALAGVEIGTGGNPTLRRCQIMDGKQAGVYVSLGGAGTFEDCAISGNTGAGVEIGWQGNPVLRRCRVNRNGRQAIRLYAGG